METWIKLYRKFYEWEWFADSDMVKFFIYLLLKVNFEEKSWKGLTVKRGQLVTSLSKLSQECNLSIQVVRTCLYKLKKTGEATYNTTNHFTVITLCNYDNYQSENEQSNTQPNISLTNKQQTINKQSTTTKEYKNIRTKEEKEITKENLEERRFEFKKTLQPYSEEFTQTTVDAFFNYCSEASGKKMRWEMEKVFEIKRRLSTWKSREKKSTESYNPKNLF